MIYYFSGTGNSEWVARQLAEKTHDTARSMADMVKAHIVPPPIGENDVLGIVFPVYAWSAPKYVTDFVKRIKVHKKAFVFAVATCESETGFAFAWLRPYIRIHSRYSVVMPNNYVVWGYGTNNKAYHRRVIENARAALGPIAGSILARRKESKVSFTALPLLKSFVIAPLFRLSRSDRRFYADDKCIGCGKCEAVCPISDIRLVNGRPVWQHKKCMQCCACINRCPVKAIQYGNATQNSGRYVFPD